MSKREFFKNRIGIVGHFGGKELFTDGQSVKIKSLYEGLSYYYPDLVIDKVDTYYLKKNPFIFIFSLFRCLIRNKKIIFLPAARGRKYMFCVFYYIFLLFKYLAKKRCLS